MGVHLPVGPAFFINTIRALRAGYIFRFPPNSDDHCDGKYATVILTYNPMYNVYFVFRQTGCKEVRPTSITSA